MAKPSLTPSEALNKAGRLASRGDTDKAIRLLNAVLGDVARMGGHDQLVLIFSDLSGIDASTKRRLAGIAAHNDVVILLTFDPSARGLALSERLVVGAGAQQAEVDLGQDGVREAFGGFYRERLDRILAWQREINL